MASFSFSLIPVNLLCLSLYAILDKSYFTKTSMYLSVLCVSVAAIFCYLDLGFVVTALPLSFAASIPLGVTSYQLFMADRNKRVFGLIAFVLILFSIHGFNFAFFRMDPMNQLWGWPIAYALYQAIAALLPSATLAEFHHRESSRMQTVILEQTKDLELANKNLKNTASFKKFLFRTLSHDIATPLLIAKASLSTFKTKNQNLISDQNIERIDRSIHKMIQISNDLKQIESKNLDIRNCSVLECIISCEEHLSSMLEAKHLKLVYNTDDLQKVGISVHKTSFVNSVLENIIRNSIKFSPRDQVINISAGLEDKNHSWIKIANLGSSIPKVILENIFDFNFNKNSLGTDGEQGTGWGLPICKIILDNYGGKISLTSLPSKTSHLDIIEVKLLLKGMNFDLHSLRVS